MTKARVFHEQRLVYKERQGVDSDGYVSSGSDRESESTPLLTTGTIEQLRRGALENYRSSTAIGRAISGSKHSQFTIIILSFTSAILVGGLLIHYDVRNLGVVIPLAIAMLSPTCLQERYDRYLEKKDIELISGTKQITQARKSLKNARDDCNIVKEIVSAARRDRDRFLAALGEDRRDSNRSLATRKKPINPEDILISRIINPFIEQLNDKHKIKTVEIFSEEEKCNHYYYKYGDIVQLAADCKKQLQTKRRNFVRLYKEAESIVEMARHSIDDDNAIELSFIPEDNKPREDKSRDDLVIEVTDEAGAAKERSTERLKANGKGAAARAVINSREVRESKFG